MVVLETTGWHRGKGSGTAESFSVSFGQFGIAQLLESLLVEVPVIQG